MTCQRSGWVLVVAATIVVTLSAQTSRPTFEVASVKRRVGPGPSTSVSPSPQAQRRVFDRLNTTVAGLILFAFDLQGYQLLGGPGWMRTDRFDVNARADIEVSIGQMRLMVQSLLEDRFALIAHKEQREMPIYSLLLARPDGRMGPNLKRSDDDCKRMLKPPADVPAGAATTIGCVTMAGLAQSASTRMGSPVLDRTGLDGQFEFFVFTSRERPLTIGSSILPAVPADRDVDIDLPTYTTALREQLGLTLDATRGAVDVLVVDSIQPPTEN